MPYIPAAASFGTPGRLDHHEERRPGVLLFAALAASVLLHAVAVVVDASAPAQRLTPPAERPINVAILGAEELATLTRPPVPVVAPAPNEDVPSRPKVAAPPTERNDLNPATPRMVRPTAMLSARELADPRSAHARAVMATLDDTDRMIQLCGIEAMAQVHAWRESLRPDRIVSYAGGDVTVSGNGVDAGEAAFRSGDAWYALAYQCRLSPDHASVGTFAFAVAVGDVVPRREWAKRNLPDPALDRD